MVSDLLISKATKGVLNKPRGRWIDRACLIRHKADQFRDLIDGDHRVWGTEVTQRGSGAEPRWGSGANIVSCDHCIKLKVAILAELIKIVSTVSILSFSTLLHVVHTDTGMGAPPP